MTKVQVNYRFSAPVDEAQLERIATAHSTFGLLAVRVSPALDTLQVTYDASRLKLEEVDHALHTAGLAVERQ